MLKIFKRRRPTHRAVPDQTSLQDLFILRWYGYSPAQWTALPALVKVDKREGYYQAQGLAR